MRAAAAIIALVFAGFGWWMWGKIDNQHLLIQGLRLQIAVLQTELDEVAQQEPEVSDADLAAVENRLAQSISDLQFTIGTSPFVGNESVWEAIDTLVDQIEAIPGLIAAMIPPPSPAPAVGFSADEAMRLWCAEYRLALENAGNAAARARGLNQMNRGIYGEWVADPLEEAGCPRPEGY